MPDPNKTDSREELFLDIDRMVNEGLGGGRVSRDNGLIEETTTDTLELHDTLIENNKKSGKNNR